MEATITAMMGRTLAALAEDNTTGLTRFAYVLCGDRGLAEDLVQEAFVALYRRFGEFLPIAAPVAYSRRSIVNAHISNRRRRAASAPAALPDRQRAFAALRTAPALTTEDSR